MDKKKVENIFCHVLKKHNNKNQWEKLLFVKSAEKPCKHIGRNEQGLVMNTSHTNNNNNNDETR